MLGRKSRFQTRVKAVSPSVISVHYFIHRFALAAKLLPFNLKTSLNLIAKMVNYIKISALNRRLFKVICEGYRIRIHIIAVSYGSEVTISREYRCASFCVEKRAASVLPKKRSQISEDSSRRKLHLSPCLLSNIFGVMNLFNCYL